MTEEEIRELLKQKILVSGKTREQFAVEELGVTESFLYAVLSGRRPPSSKVQEYLGVTRKIVYEDEK